MECRSGLALNPVPTSGAGPAARLKSTWGARWAISGNRTVRYADDHRFSQPVKAMGYKVARNDTDVATNVGFTWQEFVRRPGYYVDNDAAKPGGVEHFARMVERTGHRLEQDQTGESSIRPAEGAAPLTPTAPAPAEPPGG